MLWVARCIGQILARKKIQRANLDGSHIEDLVTQGLEGPTGIALDVVGGKMYWTDSGTEKIQRANLDGSHIEDLVKITIHSVGGSKRHSVRCCEWQDVLDMERFWHGQNPTRKLGWFKH